jgi:hypothetical protein
MSTVSDATKSSWSLDGYFPDQLSEYEVERTGHCIQFETDEETNEDESSAVGKNYQCLHRVAKPVLYERLQVNGKTTEGRSFKKDMLFSTHFKPDLLSSARENEINNLKFRSYSRRTTAPSDFYSMKDEILGKLKSRESRIQDCFSVRPIYAAELFPQGKV